MIKENKILFEELLKKREQLSKQNKKKQKVSGNDVQLIDVIENFNEYKEYKDTLK